MTNIKNDLNGWLIINKPKGISSGAVIGRLKFLLHPKKIGHAGTLDPLATGVLPIALGKATRLIPFVMDETKTYAFRVKWGVETTTDDLAGPIIARSEQRPTKEEILNTLSRFSGKITQTPSPYSAIKIGGKRAYDLARQGKTIQMPARQVNIYQLQLIRNTKNTASFIAQVSKGTYIRTLAHDLAHALGTVGVVTQLHRLQDGPFDIKKAVPLESNLKILPMKSVLGKLPQLHISDAIAQRLQNGQRIKDHVLTKGLPNKVPLLASCLNQPIALVHIEKGVIHPDCVLAC